MNHELVTTHSNGGIMPSQFGEPVEEGLIVLEDASPMSQATKAEVDIQISTAKRYPRSLAAFKQQALDMATFDEEIASGCFYSLPRGGKPIVGPSARLAEIVLSAWGNVRADSRVIAVDDKEITAEAMTWDLEKNVAVRVQVKRRITDKNGRRYNDDMITVTGNAACSIALRNSVFKVIPMVYTKAVYDAARKVAVGDIQTLAAKRSATVEYFGKMGVTPDRVFAAVGKAHIEEIGLEDVAALKGLATAIKDGDIDIDNAFPQIEPDSTGKGVSSVAEKLAKAKAEKEEQAQAAAAAAAQDPAAEQSPAQTEQEPEVVTGEVVASVEEMAEEVAAENAAEDADDLDELEQLRASVKAQLEEFPKTRRKDLMVGIPLISKATADELLDLSAFLEQQREQS